MTFTARKTTGAAISSPLAPLADWVTAVVESLGYGGVAFLIALETLFPPIPSELILPLAGFLTGQGRFWLPVVVAAATAGSVVGALLLYALGAWLGEQRLRGLVGRFGGILTLREADIDRADAWFDRHGGTAVLIGRLVPVVRSLISIPAGLRRMPLGRFVLYTAVGSSIWNGLLIGLGWALAACWQQVNPYGRYLEYGALALLLAAIVWFFHRRARPAARGDRLVLPSPRVGVIMRIHPSCGAFVRPSRRRSTGHSHLAGWRDEGMQQARS